MRAVVVDDTGTMTVRDVPDPVPGPGEVLLQVAATAVNRGDLLQRRGRYPPPPGASDIMGLEAAGTVRETGPGVEGWRAGDRAMALLAGGGYAELVAVPAGQLMPVPDGIDLTSAAAIPEVFLTAWLTLRHLTGLAAGERVLVHAAGSGVGTAAVQIARELGAGTVVGTVRTAAKSAAVRDLGATVVVADDASFADAVRDATGGHGADVVLDLVGASYWPETLRCLAVGARVSVVGIIGGGRIDLDLAALMRLQATVTASLLRPRSLTQKAALTDGFSPWAAARFADGRLRPLIHATLPLRDVTAAHEMLEKGTTVGKVVLRIGSQEPEPDAIRFPPDPSTSTRNG